MSKTRPDNIHDAIRWTDGTIKTVRAVREHDGDIYLLFHELSCEYSLHQLHEIGVRNHFNNHKIVSTMPLADDLVQGTPEDAIEEVDFTEIEDELDEEFEDDDEIEAEDDDYEDEDEDDDIADDDDI